MIKANITTRWEILNIKKITEKYSENNIKLAAHTQILKQNKTKKYKWHEPPHTSQY
jgi:hypothetical protein